jgi:uncharacterized protein YjiS (DUF1127 family)
MKQLNYQDISLPTGKASGADAIEIAIANVAASLRRWHRRSAQRRRLAGLPIDLLDDMGITEAQRLDEISKPFWRA